jgi:hypothetical protein
MRLNLLEGAETVGLSTETLGYIERARNNRGRVYQTTDNLLVCVAAGFRIPAAELEEIGRDEAARMLESLPAEPAIADADLLAAADDMFDALAGGRADADVIRRLWYRSFDAEARLKPLEVRMREVAAWVNTPRGTGAETAEGTG